MFEKDQTVWDLHMIEVGYNLAQKTLEEILDEMYSIPASKKTHILELMKYFKTSAINNFKKKYLHIEDKDGVQDEN